MSFWNSLRAWLSASAEKRKNRDGPDARAHRSYFEGFTAYREKRPGKRDRIVRVYTDDYYRQNFSPAGIVGLRLLYLALFGAVAWLFAGGALGSYPGHGMWFVTLAEVACAVFLFWMLIALANYLFSGFNWTIYIYGVSSRRLIKASGKAALCFGAAGIAVPVSWLFFQGEGLLASVQACMLRYLAAGGICLCMRLIEKRVPYKRVPSGNSAPPPDGGAGDK